MKRGATRSSRALGAGCDGRDHAQRAACMRTNGWARTAKSCGPGLPVLRPSLRDVDASCGRRGQERRSPRRARISRNPFAQGRPDVRLVPVVLPRAFLLHADHGCDLHPAFPAPSRFQRDTIAASLGRIAQRERRRAFIVRQVWTMGSLSRWKDHTLSPLVIPGRAEARARNPFHRVAWGTTDSGLALRAPRNDDVEIWRDLSPRASLRERSD